MMCSVEVLNDVLRGRGKAKCLEKYNARSGQSRIKGLEYLVTPRLRPFILPKLEGRAAIIEKRQI